MKKIMFVWCTSIILMCNSMFAIAQTSALHDEYIKFKNNDTSSVTLSNGETLNYEVQTRERKGSVEIIVAKLDDPIRGEIANYNNFVVTLDHQSESIHGFIDSGAGQFSLRVDPQSQYLWQKTAPPAVLDELLETEHEVLPFAHAAAEAVGEKDASGRYVIDVFVGFSDSAAAYVGDINLAAQTYVESVNLALANSNIQLTYLRLVGVGTSPQNPGVVTSVLRDGPTWFSAEVAQYAPDLISFIQMPTDAAGSAGGWAGVGGQTNVIGAPWPSAYRHEIGHNAGGVHCKPASGSGYHYGYSLGEGQGTSQCGNNLSYYSTPLVHDEHGNVLGTDHSQDMARVWRERAAEMSQNRIHTVPFDDESNQSSLVQAEDYSHAYDITAGNTGGGYRDGNVDIESTTDTDGGFNVGWIRDGEWLTYSVDIPSTGDYEIAYRVASPQGGGAFQFEKAGGEVVYGTIDVPATGGWQTWDTIKHTVTLTAGKQEVAIAVSAGQFNLNWFDIKPVIPAEYNIFTLLNRWRSSQYIHAQNNVLNASNISPESDAAQWVFQPVPNSSYFLIRNKKHYDSFLHVQYGVLESSQIDRLTWWSAQWQIETISGSDFVRIRNRWNPDLALNVEQGFLDASEVKDGYWSAQWSMQLK